MLVLGAQLTNQIRQQSAANNLNSQSSIRGNYIFISIPKTGSTTISELPIREPYLCPRTDRSLPRVVGGRDHQGYDVYKSIASAAELKKRFIFAFVRNPWDRVASLFHHRKNIHGCFDDFEKFVKKYQNASDFQTAPKDYKNQLDWLKDPHTNTIAVDFIGRFENYEEDVNKVMKQISENNELWYKTLPNKNGDGPNRKIGVNAKNIDKLFYRSLYTPRSRDIIYEKCKGDIEYFKYEF